MFLVHSTRRLGSLIAILFVRVSNQFVYRGGYQAISRYPPSKCTLLLSTKRFFQGVHFSSIGSRLVSRFVRALFVRHLSIGFAQRYGIFLRVWYQSRIRGLVSRASLPTPRGYRFFHTRHMSIFSLCPSFPLH